MLNDVGCILKMASSQIPAADRQRHIQLFIKTIPLLFCILISCNSNSNQGKKPIQSFSDLTGKVFIVAPNIDSTRCLAYGECDCCAGHYLFINDSEFIAVEYCLESDTYFNGTYSYNNHQVIFSTQGQHVNKEYLMDEEADSINNDAGEYKLRSNKGKPIKFNWLIFTCKNTASYITEEAEQRFVTVDFEGKFEELIQKIREEGIWDSLGVESNKH